MNGLQNRRLWGSQQRMGRLEEVRRQGSKRREACGSQAVDYTAYTVWLPAACHIWNVKELVCNAALSSQFGCGQLWRSAGRWDEAASWTRGLPGVLFPGCSAASLRPSKACW